MTNLSQKYVGKLPPGAKAMLRAELNSLKPLVKDGIVKGVKIMPGPGCQVAEAQAGEVYLLDDVPQLPLPGCKRSPCCGCCYQGVVS